MEKLNSIDTLNCKLQDLFQAVDDVVELTPEPKPYETAWEDLFAEVKNLQEMMEEMSADSVMDEYHEVGFSRIHCVGADEEGFCGALEDRYPLDFDSETFMELSEDHDDSTVTEFRHAGFNGVWTGTFEDFKDTFFPGGSFCKDAEIERLEMDILFDTTVYHAVVQTKAESRNTVWFEQPDQDGFCHIFLTRRWRNSSTRSTVAYFDIATGRVVYTDPDARTDKQVQELIAQLKKDYLMAWRGEYADQDKRN